MAKPDPLAEYNRKRDFAKTAEPAGKRVKDTAGNVFMVQKHAATRLHYDLRLEVDGVLKSWAVTKGPSLDPDNKRLAVRTEDHPLSYATFEGVIPAGEYGGGTVMLWDRGTWAPIPGKSATDIDDGHLHFTLAGERMKGEWLLVRMKPRVGEKRENWLLRKVQDDFAQRGDGLVEHELNSVSTGRTMAEIASGKKAEAPGIAQKGDPATKVKASKRRPAAHAGRPPAFRPLQLATLVDNVPTGNDWIHEIKYDGYRALIAAAGGDVHVFTRNGHDWTEKFGPLVEAVARLDLPPCLIDGEIVAYGKDGNPSFSALQAVLKRGHGSQGPDDLLEFYAFDLLEQDGKDLAPLSNIERKERLEALLHEAEPPVRLADHVIGAGEKLLETMCAHHQEGIISKRADASYSGKRSKAWVKIKCTNRQEFVVVGWTKSSSRARPFGSLLLAQNDGEAFVYKGKVGTGFDADSFADLAARFTGIVRKTPPVDVPRVEARGTTWLKPELVAEIAFAEFTADGRIRHASFIGLRADKPAKDVTSEVREQTPDAKPKIEISNRDRVIFPDSGETKGDLADYYSAVATLMLPFSGNRPISLVRCPQGRAKKCFFQKHDTGGLGTSVHHVAISEKDGGSEDYLYVTDGEGLLQCVQMGTIEFHGWGARADSVELPDRMIFDLDPDEGLDFGAVKHAARDIRDRLSDLGLVSFAMLSGGKGVHVVVPLAAGHTWDVHKDFSRRFAEALSQAEPDRFVATMSKAKRKGRIFIDWLRNQRGATAVVPYSARARGGAPVAVPISWNELEGFDHAHPYSIGNAKKLIERATSRSLSGWGFSQQVLPPL
ncbi:DNA ligase D [Novosphingobium sp. CECT 9465]|uniref:DNA ligase D n=1 Tax=Novosphingobium sp. CECT 9465 TaxID=2829794 RepID=UPI001E3554B7|nr:DNA ligase D [Novosphingobium sp. CECT 9465]CAH0496053.1 Multifunctional non-homologous end joining protein LigD [Novosphingobium sp. CECT 9465]